MNSQMNKPKGARWMEAAFEPFLPCGIYPFVTRNAFELEAWQMVYSADNQTQRAIFGATINELMDSEDVDFGNWKANPMNSNAEPIGRFAITLSNAGKVRLLKFIADRRRIGESWHDIAEQCGQLRQNNAGEYPKRRSSRAFILETAARLLEGADA